ncbi:MAG TPA: hypothetical protein PLG58_07960 [Flexilinea sp.]|nr:hypothetical protein [Flexilinea sp.]
MIYRDEGQTMQGNFIANSNRFSHLGFHYYNDIDHYDEASLDFWLPKLKAAGTRWIVLFIPERAEIPEIFLTRLINAGIEPIINLQLSLSNPPNPELFRQRTAYYQHCGVHLIHFFSRPNMKSSWSVSDWQRPNLVEHFITVFCGLAEICIANKIIPVFPVLTPGGDYWDIPFLKESLRILRDHYAQSILPNMVFSADAGFQEHSIDWGKGGPAAYPSAGVYSENNPDHRGFHIYEWYQAIIRDILKKTYPMVLFQAGQWSLRTGPFDISSAESRRQFFRALTLVQQSVQNHSAEDELPSYIVCCNFYKLPTDYVLSGKAEKDEKKKSAFFKAGKTTVPNRDRTSEGKTISPTTINLAIRILNSIFPIILSALSPDLQQLIEKMIAKFKSVFSALFPSGENQSDYFLIPDVIELLSEDQRQLIQQYLQTTNCKAGRNLNEALTSKKVILVNDKTLYPQNIIKQLQSNNCQVRTLSVSKR